VSARPTGATPARRELTGAGLVAFAAICFGTLGPVTRFADDAGVGSLALVAWRAAIGGVAALLLLVTLHTAMAIFLAVWGLVVVGLVDNVIKPLLIKRGMAIHGGVVFFSLLGGLAAFGAIGLVVGPLAVSMFLSLLTIYHRDFSPQKRGVPDVPGVTGD